ncbi:hypothetical protein QOZ80_1BG0081100 [Eleusine coracana subsp. coracana]|nr:hypothetical protein QOZ80_1BG0081100 [Eleusine coracana subsp. coracana]
MAQVPPSELVRDWSELPADLLLHVFSTLEIPDVFSAGAVCHNWRSTYLEARRCGCFSPDQSPYLVFASSTRDPNTATLQNLITEKVYHISLPDPPFHSRHVMGSSHGWLVTADDRSHLLLVNPVTGHQIAMPPPETMKNVELHSSTVGALDQYNHFYLTVDAVDFDTHPNQILSLEEGRFYFYKRVILSSDPSSGNCIVVTLQTLEGLMFFTRMGDSRWTWLNVHHYCVSYHDVFFNKYDNLFYAIGDNGDVHAIDLSGPSPLFSIVIQTGIILIDNRKYIVRSDWGDLLEVWRYHKYVGDDPRTDTIVVYKIDHVGKKLVEVKDLQGYALFIGFTGSFFLHSKDFPTLAPNNIYYAEDYLEWIFCHRFGFREIGAFNLEDDSFTDL